MRERDGEFSLRRTQRSRKSRFEFGENWGKFSKTKVTEERIAIALEHILDFLGRENLEGERFLDIGCGSGIHSLAAVRAGASEVFSFDYDPLSVEATRYCRSLINAPQSWQVESGDALDPQYVEGLGEWPLVYSWGVLHHTGDVWLGLEHALKCVAPGGLFYVALYSEDRQQNPEYWLKIKEKYANSSSLKKEFMLWSYIVNKIIKWKPWKIPKIIKKSREYKKRRGMDYITDIRDWLGGWPMEFVKDDEVVAFANERGFDLEKIIQIEANTEFLFRRSA
jgi:2-polyprenyl-6-hydroxyphenyl methylase/3-demethylubiquinone-9 3-methyltransferase